MAVYVFLIIYRINLYVSAWFSRTFMIQILSYTSTIRNCLMVFRTLFFLVIAFILFSLPRKVSSWLPTLANSYLLFNSQQNVKSFRQTQLFFLLCFHFSVQKYPLNNYFIVFGFCSFLRNINFIRAGIIDFQL